MKFIAIEGTDGSGKHTQSELLRTGLQKLGFVTEHIEFPNYDKPYAAQVKGLISGEFGPLEEMSPYSSSMIFAMERFAFFRLQENKHLFDADVVVSDRYVPSNAVHQAARIKDKNEKNDFLDWLEDFEYEKNGVPRPDGIIFLAVPPDVTERNMKTRESKSGGKDILEADKDYLLSSYQNAMEVGERMGFHVINCVDKNGNQRTKEDISEEVLKVALEILRGGDN